MVRWLSGLVVLLSVISSASGEDSNSAPKQKPARRKSSYGGLSVVMDAGSMSAKAAQNKPGVSTPPPLVVWPAPYATMNPYPASNPVPAAPAPYQGNLPQPIQPNAYVQPVVPSVVPFGSR